MSSGLYAKPILFIGPFISRACETLYSVASPKFVDLSVNVLPFLVIQFAYLISASWLPRIGLATRTGVSGYTKI